MTPNIGRVEVKGKYYREIARIERVENISGERIRKRVNMDIIKGNRYYIIAEPLTKSGRIIPSYETGNFSQAKKVFNLYVNHYIMNDELKSKYDYLKLYISLALGIGQIAEKRKRKDSGGVNFDAVAINLPQYKKEKVEQIAKEAGTMAFVWKSKEKRYFVIEPITSSNRDARRRNVNEMMKFLNRISMPIKIDGIELDAEVQLETIIYKKQGDINQK